MSLVTYVQQRDVALVTLDDGKANAMNLEMIGAVNEALDRAEQDAKAVILTGRPGVLSGGFDLKVLRSGDAAAQRAMLQAGARLLMRLYGFPKPVVTATGGHGVALGAFLLLAADYRIGVVGDFKIGLNEVALGMTFPPFALMLAKARIASQHLANAVINATIYLPQDAIEPGFLDAVVDRGQLLDRSWEKAQSLSALAGSAFAQTKRDIRGGDIDAVLAAL